MVAPSRVSMTRSYPRDGSAQSADGDGLLRARAAHRTAGAPGGLDLPADWRDYGQIGSRAEVHHESPRNPSAPE